MFHIKHIFEDGELNEDSVVRKFRTTAADGKEYLVSHYNLDMIIALGYRVRSIIATRFRQWATERLKEYIVKGFTLDDERLKKLGGGSYWKELLERIRDIRATEKVLYRQILEIYATSIDYDPRAQVSQEFFKKVQNKIHFAIHGHTAAELIVERADAEKDFMGLMTFNGNHPTLIEAKTAKNYLNEKELRAMGQLVSGYLDFAERQAEREQVMTMNDWAAYLDRIGIVIKFIPSEFTGRLSRIFPIKLIAFYIVGSGFRADFSFFSHVWSHHSRKVAFHVWNIKLGIVLNLFQIYPYIIKFIEKVAKVSVFCLPLQQINRI